MNQEYQRVLEYYVDLSSRNRSEKFLEKYWLVNSEYLEYWLPIARRVFNMASRDLPDLMFNGDLELIAQRGGVVFTKEEYLALQECMQVAGDEYFVLIENEYVRDVEGSFPHLRFKFLACTSWEELNNGSEDSPDISLEALFVMNKHFFVFGDSGKWGKYTANDYGDTPLDIIGFKPELASIFQSHFKQSKEEREEIWEWLPPAYKAVMKK